MGFEVKTVSLDKIEFNTWNPNKFDTYKFDELVKEVIAEGVDQPVICVKGKDGKYIVVDGEHRVRAARSAGLKEIPIVVKTDWDEDKAKIETVRRNVLRGEMDKAKFTDLVNDVVANTNSPVEDIVKKMALTEDEFRDLYIARADIQSKLLEEVQVPKEKALYEDVSYIVQKIMEENKDNIDKGYVYFMFKGALVCCVEMDREDKNRLYELLTNSQERGKNLNKLLVEKILGPKPDGKTKNTD